MLDSSIVNVAVEPIARELRASLTTVGWAVSGYLLALGAGLAATAYLARRYGIGLIAALFSQQSRAHRPVAALHTTGILIAALSAAGLAGGLLLPRIRNEALR